MADPTLATKVWQIYKTMVRSLSLDLPVSWPGDSSFRDVSTRHLDVGYLFARPELTGIRADSTSERRGTLQITVMEPLGSSNANDVALQMAGTIAEDLRPTESPRVFRDVRLWTTEYPHVMEGFEDGQYWAVPVRIRTVCDA